MDCRLIPGGNEAKLPRPVHLEENLERDLAWCVRQRDIRAHAGEPRARIGYAWHGRALDAIPLQRDWSRDAARVGQTYAHRSGWCQHVRRRDSPLREVR